MKKTFNILFNKVAFWDSDIKDKEEIQLSDNLEGDQMISDLIIGGVLAAATYYLYKEYFNTSIYAKIGIIILALAALTRIKRALFK